MRECIAKTFDMLIKAKTPIIMVNTYEEESFINDVCDYASMNSFDVAAFSAASGIDKYDTVNKCITSSNMAGFNDFANEIDRKQNSKEKNNKEDYSDEDELPYAEEKNNAIYIVKDAHIVIENATIKRKIRDLKEYKYINYCPLILLTPVTSIPIELEKLVTVFNYDLPNRDEVTKTVMGLISALKKKVNSSGIDFIEPDKELINATINSLIGLTLKEIKYILMRSAMEYNTLNLDLISQCKINMVEKSGLLDYVIPKISFDDIGGNAAFKTWIDDVATVFSDEAKDFGCEVPKGYMALGIAGTGKTVIAEAIAKKLGVPMFVFNVSKIFDKLVGQSEKKIEQALRIVKSSAPCVLLFDEAEKIFGGYGGSDCDGGTSSRVFSSILRFLAENDKVFIVMTSNDVRKLPPELTRSGRLDTTWYFGFPTQSERRDIFKIHFEKTGHIVPDNILERAAKRTHNFTGAEIKNVVKQTIWQSFKNYKSTGKKEITIDDIDYAISKIVPTYKTSREKIDVLERYAKGRALFANDTSENINEDDFDDDLLKALDK